MKSAIAAAAFGIALTLPVRAEQPQPPARTVIYEHSFCSSRADAFTGAIVAEGVALEPDERRALSKALDARGAALRGYFRSISESGGNQAAIEGFKDGLFDVLKSAVEEAKPALNTRRAEVSVTFNVFRDRRHQCREILVMRA